MVSAFFAALAGTCCIYPGSDGQAELTYPPVN